MRSPILRSLHNMKWILSALPAAKRWVPLFIILIILIPASFLFNSRYQKSISILEEEVTHSKLQTLKQVSINLNTRFSAINDISNSIFMNPNMYRFLAKAYDYEPISQQVNMLNELRHIIYAGQTNLSVFRVRLFVDNTKIYSDENVNFFSIDRLDRYEWFNSVLEASGGIVWTGSYKEHYIDAKDTYILSAARVLRDPNDFERIVGVLVIDMEEQNIERVLHHMDFSEKENYYLIDSTGTIVSHTDHSLVGTQISHEEISNFVLASDEGVKKINFANKSQYIIFTSFQSTKWKLVAEIPTSEIIRNTVRLNQFSNIIIFLGLAFLVLLFIFALLVLLMQGMIRRMQLVTQAIQNEEIHPVIPPASHVYSEYSQLEQSVDRLIDKVKHATSEAYMFKVSHRESQLRALQAQINPHFLYNTLDMINWLAIDRDAHDISHMIEGLAQYFRLSLNKGRDLLSVADELNLAKVYLEIQQNRFHSFEFSITSDSNTDKYLIPKLIVQPIVENALMHGIRKSAKKKGLIRIRVQLRREELVFTVSDNGIGMSKEHVSKLLDNSSDDADIPADPPSYGLLNVHERIKIFAGDKYGLRIKSQIGTGTVVRVKLKVPTEA